MISILSGSSRKNSNTLRVAKAIQKQLLSKQQESIVIDFHGYDIPNFNQENMNNNELSEWMSRVQHAMSHSELIFVLSPEYNWLPSAEMIQFINQTTSSHFGTMWENKTFAIVGTSSGRGGRLPAIHLSNAINKIISVFNYHSIVSAKIFESQFTPNALDENGNSIGNSEYDKGLTQFVDYSLSISHRFSKK